jgi:hypothetical protein
MYVVEEGSMPYWEYIGVEVTASRDAAAWVAMVLQHDRSYHPSYHPKKRLLWEPFCASLHAKGWQMVPAEPIDDDPDPSLHEYTFKRIADAPACEGLDLPDLDYATDMIVRLDLSTSCAGSFWEPTYINGIPRTGNIVPDHIQCYNQLGASGWELVAVRTLPERGLYYDDPPREARFTRSDEPDRSGAAS